MTKPGLLLWTESAGRLIGDQLDDQFEVIRLWQAEDPQAVLRTRGDAVVATLTNQLDAGRLAQLANLRLIAVPGAGYDGVDVAAARARGVTVVNAHGVHNGDVADHALALTLAAVHRLPQMQDWVASGAWLKGAPPERRHAMKAQRFGVVGLGAIGSAIADRLVPFGGKIAWWSPTARPAPWPRRESLLDLARWCTVLIVAARGDAAGLIDEPTIAAVGAQGLIVNISRGKVIEEDALIAALRDGRLGAAALDVFVQEPTPPDRWRGVPNVILTPHVAGVSQESVAALRAAAIRNLTSLFGTHPPVHEVVG